ncbi:MAG TPA: creatininase family protein [Candidatus Angelobacter sp.]|nr:creatininase family protein [Candidatus Angelobacter sp.]
MKLTIILIFILSAITLHSQTKTVSPARGILLEDLTWVEAEKVLTPDKVVVIPLGAESKEHGPHLKLKNDWLIAQYLRDRVLEKADVVVAPTLNYSYYPAFLEYPGSTSLRLETARDVVADICRSLARFGPRRFYVINTGVSTLAALKPASELLASEGIVMRYTNILEATSAVEKKISKQEGGTHADEIETSIMLYIAPETVNMKKAVKDYHPGKGPLTRDPKATNGVYSPSGIFGDPTLATVEKGAKLSEALAESVLAEIEQLQRSPVPAKPKESENR